MVGTVTSLGRTTTDERLGRRQRCLTFCSLAIALLFVLPGCFYEMMDCLDEEYLKLKYTEEAKQSYLQNYWSCYRGVDHPWDFKHGFIDGYLAVAMGGDGCPPMFPPRKYWGGSYDGGRGRDRAMAWFDGYQHGVLVAHENNRGGGQMLILGNQPGLAQSAAGPRPDPQPNALPGQGYYPDSGMGAGGAGAGRGDGFSKPRKTPQLRGPAKGVQPQPLDDAMEPLEQPAPPPAAAPPAALGPQGFSR